MSTPLVIQYATRHPTLAGVVRITWNVPANATDAATSGNYAISGGVTVSAAAVVAGSGNLQADLTCSGLTTGVVYTLTVSNVKDIATSTAIISPNNQLVFTWQGIGDNNLDGIPIHGGTSVPVVSVAIGDRPLGYNVLGAIDINPPQVLNVTPTSGTNISGAQPISFDVVDDVGFRRIVVRATYPDGTWDFVHDFDNFGPNYAGSTRTPITGGWHYSILRNGGWVIGHNPTITAYAIDTGGNEAA